MHAWIQNISLGGPDNFLAHHRILQRAVRKSLEKQVDPELLIAGGPYQYSYGNQEPILIFRAVRSPSPPPLRIPLAISQSKPFVILIKIRKVAKIRNRYNQVPHLTQDITFESDKNTIRHHKQEPRGQPFLTILFICIVGDGIANKQNSCTRRNDDM